MLKLPILVTLLTILAQNGQTAFMKNKYKVEIAEVDVCPNNNQTINPIRNLKYSSYNRTHKALSYDFAYDRPLDENVGGTFSIAKWGDGGWREIPFMGFQSNMCESMLNFFRDNWVDVHKKAGVKNPDKCPVPAGNYSVKDYIMDTSMFDIPFFSGRFKIVIKLIDDRTEELIQCYLYVVKIDELF